jgi:hypothetical protein
MFCYSNTGSIKSQVFFTTSVYFSTEKISRFVPLFDWSFILNGQKELIKFCKNNNLSFYSLLNYKNQKVPIFIEGIGFGSLKRKNTSGWKLKISD